jgi:ribonuclease HII
MAIIVGIDEAGRGPLAGPVSVGVVGFEEGYDILAAFPGLNDSKLLSEKKREKLFVILEEEVQKGNVSFVVEFSSAAYIDEKGIVPAVHEALGKGLEKVVQGKELSEVKVFLDGALRAPSDYTQETIIGGDHIIPAIMLASVAAKVTRDRYMTNILAKKYPVYNFEKHKGYGTTAHYAALTEHGPCSEHRHSFLKNFLTR